MTPDPVRDAIERAADEIWIAAAITAELLPAIAALRAKDAERIAAEAVACVDCGSSLHALHTGEKLCDGCLAVMDVERHGVMPPGWQRPLTLREQLAAKDQRIAELEGLIREVLNSDGNVLTMSLGCRMEDAISGDMPLDLTADTLKDTLERISAALSQANPNQGASDE